ncbi:MAG: magnesium transporter CorA family protein [Candidatus Sumerlaeota bacterium]|nr:magnesium transporter CorA family protein [Candidatus Sumerlaeota bacterium]
MIQYFVLEQGRVKATPEGVEGPIWVCVNLTDAERARLINEWQIDEHNLTSSLDRDELPRVEQEPNHLAVIFKHPRRYNAVDSLAFHIDSVGLFLFKDRLIIIAPEDMTVFEGRLFTKVQNLQMLFLRILSLCISHFIGHLQVINMIANDLENKLVRSMENRHLLQMFSIEKSLVYYVNANSANGRVIERLKTNARNTQSDGLSAEMLEYVDDLAIENAQCLEQAQVYANVFAGLMDARASIVNNNLNVLMKRLTIINVVFMPLNVLAGIGGMSEFSMMTQGVPWPVAYSFFMMALVIIGCITYWILVKSEKRSIKP